MVVSPQIKRDKGKGNWADIVEERLRTTHKTLIPIYTHGSKEPKNGSTGFAFVVPDLIVTIKERTSDHLSLYRVRW